MRCMCANCLASYTVDQPSSRFSRSDGENLPATPVREQSYLDHAAQMLQGTLQWAVRVDRRLYPVGGIILIPCVTRQRLAQRPNRSRSRTWIRAMRCCQVSTPAHSSTFSASATVLHWGPERHSA
jgi:hypothetical protein